MDGVSDEPKRWIYSYCYEGTYELSEEKRESYRKRGVIERRKAIGVGAVSVLFGVSTLMAIVIFADKPAWAWTYFVIMAIIFFKTLAIAGQKDSLGLLYRRTARKGRVDRFVPGERTLVGTPEHPRTLCYPNWIHDERFEERMVRICGHRPAWFETPSGDDVLLVVDGIEVRSICDVSSDFEEIG